MGEGKANSVTMTISGDCVIHTEAVEGDGVQTHVEVDADMVASLVNGYAVEALPKLWLTPSPELVEAAEARAEVPAISEQDSYAVEDDPAAIALAQQCKKAGF